MGVEAHLHGPISTFSIAEPSQCINDEPSSSGSRSQPPAHFEAVELWQSDIQKDEIRTERGRDIQCFPSVTCGSYDISEQIDEGRPSLPRVRAVVDYKNPTLDGGDRHNIWSDQIDLQRQISQRGMSAAPKLRSPLTQRTYLFPKSALCSLVHISPARRYSDLLFMAECRQWERERVCT